MSGEITTDDHFDGERIAPETDGYVRVGNAHHPVRNDIFRGEEIRCRDLVKDASLVGYSAWQDHIKGRYPVRGYHGHQVAEVINIPHFATVETGLAGKVEIRFLDSLHGVCRSSLKLNVSAMKFKIFD